MTNEERYKSPKERLDAFNEFCESRECHKCELSKQKQEGILLCVFRWLTLEAEEEKPIDCPCCGGKAWLVDGTDSHGYYREYVVCYLCGLQTTTQSTKGAAVAKWNRRVK